MCLSRFSKQTEERVCGKPFVEMVGNGRLLPFHFVGKGNTEMLLLISNFLERKYA